MKEDLSRRADERLEAALAESGARDPREFYRERLRELKRADTVAYEGAVAYYRDVLMPAVAGDGTDPIEEWTKYGGRLASSLAPGRTVAIDGTGRARPYDRFERTELVLHLPDKGRALLVGLPGTLTDAQRATYDVLVSGKQRLPG
jgi:hypothetical protein